MSIHTITGIELFGRDLRIVVLAGMTREVRVKKSLVFEDFVSLDIDGRRSRLAEAVRTGGIPATNVHLVLPASSGVVRQIDIPTAASPHPESVVSLQLESVSPWPVEEIWWSLGYPMTRPKAKSPLRPGVVSIVPADVARPWVELFQSAGLPLAGLSLAPAAWADGLERLFGDRPTIALGISAEQVDGVLVSGDQTIFASERAGDSAVSDTDRAIRRVMSDLVARARLADPDTVRLVARGNVPKAIASLALENLPLTHRPSAKIDNFGALAAALAPGRGRASNLIPLEDREGRNVVRLIPTLVLAGCLMLAVLGLVAREPYQYLRYGERLDAQIAELEPQVEGVIAEDARLAEAREAYATLNAILVPDRNLEALAWFAESMPLDTWITSYGNDGGVLTISGYSARTSEFQLLLEESELFESVELASPVRRDPEGRERFTIRVNVVGAS